MKMIWKPERSEAFKDIFEGEIVIDFPNKKDRLALTKELNVKLDNNGEVSLEGDEMLVLYEKLGGILETRVDSVCLIHLATGEKIESLEELEFWSDGMEIVNQITGMITRGPRLGEVSKP